LPFTAVPAEFKTAAPPDNPAKNGSAGRLVGTVGSCNPGKIESITEINAGPTPDAGPDGAGPTVIPPVDVNDALKDPVFPFTDTKMPCSSKLLVDAAVNEIPVVGVPAGVPKPITTVPLLLVLRLMLTFPPAHPAPPVKSPVQFAKRTPVVADGKPLVVFVIGVPKLMVNATTPGSVAEPAPPALTHVTLIDPPPGVGGDALNPPTSTGAPAAIGSVWPVAVARGVDPSGNDNPQLTAVCAKAALLPRIKIMPTSRKGINSRLNVIKISPY